MSSKINIGRRHAGDSHYRYKRNRFEVRYSGKGKNSKTILSNLTKIARQLYTTPEYVSKFFGSRFATVTGIDSKAKEWFLKGRHTRRDLEERLEDFIDTFILCPSCETPETSIKAKKGIVKMRCYVCGGVNKITDTTFIKYLSRCPQDDTKMYRAYTRRKAARDAAAKEAAETEPNIVVDTTGLPEDEEVVWTTDTSESAAQARVEELSGAVRKMVESDSGSYYSYSGSEAEASASSSSLNVDDI